MAKKPNKDEIIREFYGIDPKTFEVVSLSQTRGGSLSRMNRDGSSYTHHIEHGRDAKAEVLVVFGLVEIRDCHAQYTSSEHRKTIIDELQAKADRMKAEKQG